MYDLVRDHFLGTPSLFFLKDQIIARAKLIRQLTESVDCELFYPVKAFGHPNFLALIENYVDGFDVSNLEEAKKISGHKKLSVYNPYDSYGAVGGIIEEGAVVRDVILDQPFRFAGEAAENVFYRINLCQLFPEKEQSRFGVHPLDFHLLSESRNFHFHLRNPQEFSQLELLEAVKKIRSIFPKMEKLIMGGGWHKFSWEAFAEILRNVRKENPDLYLRIEPGKLFVHGLGYGVAKVLAKKVYGKSVDVIVDMSAVNHTLWCVPQLVRPKMEQAVEAIQLTVFGPSCFEADIVGRYKISEEVSMKLSIGDKLIFSGVNGYTAERQHAFNGSLPGAIHFI